MFSDLIAKIPTSVSTNQTPAQAVTAYTSMPLVVKKRINADSAITLEQRNALRSLRGSEV